MSRLFSHFVSVGKNRTAFDGEVEAIRIALVQLLDLLREFETVVILSDSQAAIQVIGSAGAPTSFEVLQCRELIRRISQENKRIKLQWIPGPCGIYGNDQADLLARKDRIKSKTWSSEDIANIPDCPRREAVALLRLVTGHNCLSDIGIFDISIQLVSPLCSLCYLGELLNRAHLHRFEALRGSANYESALYWRARERLRLQ
ncbi:uncharacterized protein [Parasteatoda tepidariorum]|uniref:uncharacterized protein n=1 Tax=Parasteatoda tepidariorum TaxID=114398 RepID=UPI0039BD6A8B